MEPSHLGRAFPIIPNFFPQRRWSRRGVSIQHLAFTYGKNISAPVSRDSKKKRKKIKISRVHLLSLLPGGPQAHGEAGKNCPVPGAPRSSAMFQTGNVVLSQIPAPRLSAANVMKAPRAVCHCKGFSGKS